MMMMKKKTQNPKLVNYELESLYKFFNSDTRNY